MTRLLLAASPWDFPLFPESASEGARQVDLIYFALVAFSALLTLGIITAIVYFSIKYRASSGADRSGKVQSTLRFELTWLILPVLISLVLFAWAARTYLQISQPPPDARTVYVVGKQWMWKVQHPEGRREIDELHVPVGVPIKLVLTSQDVIHSFYIPAFRTKQDALPDRYTTLWFEADEVGEYPFFCAEYCGAQHSDMTGTIHVMPTDEFAEWLTAEAPGAAPDPLTPGAPGAPLALGGSGPFFDLGCNACHLPRAAVRAPRLDGLYGSEVRLANGDTVLADEQYLRESILDPQAAITAGYPAPSLMPTYRGQVDEEQLQQLVEFIRELRDGWPEELTEPAPTPTAATEEAP